MGNCITGRGKSILVACVNIGAKKTEKDYHKQVYAENGFWYTKNHKLTAEKGRDVL